MHNLKEKTMTPSLQKEYEDPWNRVVIDLNALKYNYEYLRSQLPAGVIFYSVLKSDAYGHGLTEVANVLVGSGCTHFAVESPQEGIRLRNEGITAEILLMNPIPTWMAGLAVRHDLSVSVIHPDILQPLQDAAQMMGKTCRIHLNVNVGLNRLGLSPEMIIKIAKHASKMSHLEMEGLFGQPRDSQSAQESYEGLKNTFDKLKSLKIAPNYLHFANSTTFLDHSEFVADGVRLGILLYGVLPPEQFKQNPDHHLKPVMSLETEIVQLRNMPKGSKIGYRSNQKTERDMVIGTIPLGYHHGLDRNLTENGFVLIRGNKAPYIGAISMNASTIDVTDIPDIRIGDKVVLIGGQGDMRIDINEMAENSKTIGAELMMRFGKTIARHYKWNAHEIFSLPTDDSESEKIEINYYQTENELPDWMNVYDIIQFLQTHLVPYDDPQKVINTAVDYALSAHPEGKGFIFLATSEEKIIGAVVSIEMSKIGIIPENVFVYVCVHKDYRGKGLGTRIIQQASRYTNGDIKLHVEKTNPAAELLRKLGFKNDYLEMRFHKGGN
ncbi:alanine racemase [candidate division KSB1 bacterium]|nr:alanine racemase [candidate division KSB1 bacterium]